MHISSFTTISLVLGSALSAAAQSVTTKTSFETKCLTALSTKSIKNVPTNRVTKSKTLPTQTVTGYSHATTTITPIAITIVVTEESTFKSTTTLSDLTEDFTTTQSFTDTVTATVVQTSISITTASATVTTTVSNQAPTPAGFRPAADTVNRPVQKRWEEFNDAVKRAERTKQAKKPAGGCTEKSFPSSVQCTITRVLQPIKKVTVQGKPITKIAVNPIQYTTTTVTVSSIATQPPATITSTATTSTTTTVTTEELTTTTETETITDTATVTSTQTGFAACATNNIVTSFEGQGFINAYNNDAGTQSTGSTFYTAAATDATQCCEICQQNNSFGNGCQAYAFGQQRCIILYNKAATCNAGLEQGYWTYRAGGNWAVGNGPCGYFYALKSK